ncbi:MAG TPA: PQQ-like beta-propeller repeat protein [Candidatus Hydrogenedentes bacterium]|nr:PQQ-like beta-propeller repeat protein [Candidatus Hydrogenedentota bacterium]
MKSTVFMKYGFWLAVIVTLFSVCSQADWPQFQGPNRDGISPETGLLRTWPEEGPKVLWSLPLGAGYGSPSVRDGEVYILDRVDDKQDVLRCLALDTGKELWNYAYDAPGDVSHNGSRTAPTVDERCVFSVGMVGDFVCVDRKTHQPVWKKNLLTEFQMKAPGWGVVQAPSLYQDLVIVAPMAQDAYVAAFKRDTGDLVWKTASLGPLGYSTPVVLKLAGVDQAVMIGACKKGGGNPGKVAGISLDKGEFLWTYDGFQCHIPIPYPTVLPDDRLFITGGYGAGSAMIQVKQENGKFTVKELFKTDACSSQIHQPIFYKDYLYVNSNSNEREDGMLCLSLDGQVKWKTRDTWSSTTFERGNLLLADGLIYNLDGKKGILHLVEPSPEGYKELAQAKIFSGKEIWAPMALSNGKLLLRNQEEMKCLDVKNP